MMKNISLYGFQAFGDDLESCRKLSANSFIFLGSVSRTVFYSLGKLLDMLTWPVALSRGFCIGAKNIIEKNGKLRRAL